MPPRIAGVSGADGGAVNLERLRSVDGWATRALRLLLPPRCLLCGSAGTAGRDLCAGCASDFVPNAMCCPRCALPLSVPAPLCGECLARDPPFGRAWVPFVYAHPLDLLETRFKFGADLAAGRVLADGMVDRAVADRPERPEALVPVPLHAARLRERGYNVTVNDPYKGVELVRAFGRPEEGRHSLQIEIRRPVYMDEDTREPNAGFEPLRAHLDQLLAVIAAYVRGALASRA